MQTIMCGTDKTKEMLDQCNDIKGARNQPFTPWELDYLESVTEQFEERGSLTERQIDVLTLMVDKI